MREFQLDDSRRILRSKQEQKPHFWFQSILHILSPIRNKRGKELSESNARDLRSLQ